MAELLEVVEDWVASYGDPIRVTRGEALTLSGRRDLWDGHLWLWATDPRGRSGWVPGDLPTAPEGRAAWDFDAMELTCRAGQHLQGLEQRHGWWLCRDRDGTEGWVPRSHLRPFPQPLR